MNFVGIIAGDDQPVEKIVAAQPTTRRSTATRRIWWATT